MPKQINKENKKIIQHWDKLDSARSNVKAIWNEIERYVAPFKGQMFTNNSHEGTVKWNQYQLYSSLATQSAHILAASIQGGITSAVTRWFGMKFKNPTLNDDKEAKAWLEQSTLRTFDQIQESNFNLESNEMYFDIVTMATSVFTEEWNNGLVFTAIPVKEADFDEDENGQAVNFYRLLEWTRSQIVSKFGEEGLPDKIKNNKSVDEKFKILFYIFKRKEINEDLVDLSKPLMPKMRPYGFKYIDYDSYEQLGDEGGYYELPGYVVRFLKTSGSKWGHSPATIALPDIKMLNKLIEMIIIAAEKVIDPVLVVPERGMSKIDLSPGGRIVARDPSAVNAFESKARFDVSEMQRDRLEASIRAAFRVDELQLKESPAMTATEVQVRYELMQRLLGPTFGRLQNDFLGPMLQRTFNILTREGIFEPPPQSVIDSDAELEVEYFGPLSRSQRVDEVAAVQQWIAEVASISELYPEIIDNINPDRYAEAAAEMRGVPTKIMNTEFEIKKIRKNREDAQVAEAQAQQSLEGSQVAANLGKAQKDLTSV